MVLGSTTFRGPLRESARPVKALYKYQSIVPSTTTLISVPVIAILHTILPTVLYLKIHSLFIQISELP